MIQYEIAMMSTSKRRAEESTLQRRVRPRRETSAELDIPSSAASSDEEVTGPGSSGSSDEEAESSSESEAENLDAPNISFGALAKAQSTLDRPAGKKRGSEEKVSGDGWENNGAQERKSGKKDHRDFNRSNKHAPTEVSSKKAVSRKREVVPVAKREFRDPRFERIVGDVDDSKVKAAYSFLDDYREDEMKELRAAIKSTKDEDAKEKLKRALMAMESKKKTESRRRQEQEVLDRHRKEEKELVKQGKKPFYLKKAEQKKRVLLDQFSGLKGKQLDHVIERRRKKVEGREKKKMPFARREVD